VVRNYQTIVNTKGDGFFAVLSRRISEVESFVVVKLGPAYLIRASPASMGNPVYDLNWTLQCIYLKFTLHFTVSSSSKTLHEEAETNLVTAMLSFCARETPPTIMIFPHWLYQVSVVRERTNIWLLQTSQIVYHNILFKRINVNWVERASSTEYYR
jgi:hypothetical protein